MATPAAHPSTPTPPTLDDRQPAVPRELLDRAWAFDDPASYRAGVQEAIEWCRRGVVTSSVAPRTRSRR